MAAKKAKGYKELRAELDRVVAELQQDDIDVDRAMECYEQGQELIKQLEAYLKSAENKVTKIKVDLDA